MVMVKGVSIGDRFKTGKYTEAQVVDILECRSMALNGEVVRHICIARANGLANNEFEVPFSTVVRNRIKVNR